MIKNVPKIEVLLRRYKKLGYQPVNLERDLEVANIIRWIWLEYGIYIDVHYCSHKMKGYEDRHMTYAGYLEEYFGNGQTNRFYYCQEKFKTNDPFLAKYMTLMEAWTFFEHQTKINKTI